MGVHRCRQRARAPQGAAGVRGSAPDHPFVQVGTMSDASMHVKLTIWRQAHASAPGQFVDYELTAVSPEMSFLEMLDTLNEMLIRRGEEPVAFDHDCREGICGSCGMVINGIPHGPERGTATCQLHMRKFSNGAHITIEPFRASSFPVNRDLSVDRGAF